MFAPWGGTESADAPTSCPIRKYSIGLERCTAFETGKLNANRFASPTSTSGTISKCSTTFLSFATSPSPCTPSVDSTTSRHRRRCNNALTRRTSSLLASAADRGSPSRSSSRARAVASSASAYHPSSKSVAERFATKTADDGSTRAAAVKN